MRVPRRQNTLKPPKPFVGDYGAPLKDAPSRAIVSLGMTALALGIGFVVGFLVWAVLLASSAITNLIWHPVLDGSFPPFAPLIICLVGGLVIGLWSKYLGGAPESLETVLASIRKTGSYEVPHLGRSVVAFLLPLAFGGSVGPEAGLTGLIASACGWIGTTLKRAGLKVKAVTDVTVSAALSAIFGTPLLGIIATAEEALPNGGIPRDNVSSDIPSDRSSSRNTPDDVASVDVPADSMPNDSIPNPDDYTFRRGAKVVLYVAAAFGAIAGIAAINALSGQASGLPRFEQISFVASDLVWFIPCLAAGYVLALVFHSANWFFGKIGQALADKPVLKAVICGAVLGAVGCLLPYVMFSGEEQAFELMGSWRDIGAFALIATAVLKAAATPLCLNFGWRGGNLFPVIFAGISCGYGLAILTGADPTFLVTVVTATTLGGVSRKPLVTLAVLLLCFPAHGILWLGLACVIGSALPIPKRIFEH